ncbi:uncharacterized protein LOC129590025 [Paramacrobiotus metropolitanus]|uniref:uncharacterized protein LOC129590025 n=1 Tax=Paramacrobiotus metropolitanus TaxID=2943436 RepID=UPI0024461851|nr:uncharacterized protein LOC129590025 [Paramacrobiotus metropolitanus]
MHLVMILFALLFCGIAIRECAAANTVRCRSHDEGCADFWDVYFCCAGMICNLTDATWGACKYPSEIAITNQTPLRETTRKPTATDSIKVELPASQRSTHSSEGKKPLPTHPPTHKRTDESTALHTVNEVCRLSGNAKTCTSWIMREGKSDTGAFGDDLWSITSDFRRDLDTWINWVAPPGYGLLPRRPQHLKWTLARNQNGPSYLPVRISDNNGNAAGYRFVLSVQRAIDEINTAMDECLSLKLVDFNATEPVQILEIYVFSAGQLSCFNGGSFSENFGYDPNQDNIIRVNSDAFSKKEDRTIDIMFIHELLHSVFNVRHEHTRLDRDQYIKPIEKNLMCNLGGNMRNGYFDLDSEASMEFPYDLHSIMHTGWDDHSIQRFVNTVDVQPGIPAEWGIGPQSQGLSFFDVHKMRKFYSCKENPNFIHFEQERKQIYLLNWMVHCNLSSQPDPLRAIY